MPTISPPPLSNDRLGSTLFVAALIHGVVILGVTFTVTSLDDTKVPSLNVALVVDTGKEELAVETADFLSNRNQRAAGQAAKGPRPTTALSAAQPLTQAGDPQGADLTDGTPRDSTESAEQVVTRGESPEQVAAQPQPTDDPAPTRQRSASLFQHTGPQTTAMELSLRAELPNGVRRRANAARDTEHAAVRSRRVSGRLAPARRTHRHGQLSRGAARRSERRTADARGRDRQGRAARGHRGTPVFRGQSARSGGPEDPAPRVPVRAVAASRSARITTCCGSPTTGTSSTTPAVRPAPPAIAERRRALLR